MPNYCGNTLTISHEDPAMITRAVEAFDRGEFFAEFVPVPKDLQITSSPGTQDQDLRSAYEVNKDKFGYETWYDFCCNEWGTKWDVGTEGADADVTDDGKVMLVFFDSAWSPPIAAYEKLQELGFKVSAYYYESGMAFAGIYDEHGDESYDLSSMDSSEVRSSIPRELDETFCISEQIEEYERENEEELTLWYKDGVEETGLDPHKKPSEC